MEKKQRRLRLNPDEQKKVLEAYLDASESRREYVAEKVKEVMLEHADALELEGDFKRAADIRVWCHPCVNLQSVSNLVKRYREKNSLPKVSRTGPKPGPSAAAHKAAVAVLASMAAGGSPSTSAAATVGGEGGSSRPSSATRKALHQQLQDKNCGTKRKRQEQSEECEHLSQYEHERLERIESNNAFLKKWGLDHAPQRPTPPPPSGGGDKGKAAADTAPAPQRPTPPPGGGDNSSGGQELPDLLSEKDRGDADDLAYLDPSRDLQWSASRTQDGGTPDAGTPEGQLYTNEELNEEQCSAALAFLADAHLSPQSGTEER